jgi:hypothetical protein
LAVRTHQDDRIGTLHGFLDCLFAIVSEVRLVSQSAQHPEQHTLTHEAICVQSIIINSIDQKDWGTFRDKDFSLR